MRASMDCFKLSSRVCMGVILALAVWASIPSCAHADEMSVADCGWRFETDSNGAVVPSLRHAMQEDVLDVYWTFSGVMGGNVVGDVVVYRTYKTLSFPNSYSTLAPTNLSVRSTGSGGEYFPQVGMRGFGTVEVWKMNYRIR